MVLYPLTSKQVLEFMPLDAWTEVHLQPSNVKNVCFVTTKDKIEKRKKDIQSISLESSLFNKIQEFKVFEIVAVEIEDRWFRGKLISFNEFLTDNTIILLIDFGYVYRTNLENLFVLPYYFKYEPLVLPVTFKDFIPKESTFSIKPLLSESNLHEGSVLVNVNCNDTKLEKQLLDSKKNINSANDSKIISVKNNITNGHDSYESSLYPSRKPFAIEFNENSKSCLENVKLKDIENGSYINSKYLMKRTSTQIDESIKKSQNITENEIVSVNTPELEVTSNIELRTGDTVFCTHFEDFNHPYLCKNNTTPGKSYFYNLWQNDPVPLTLRFNEFNFNYINEISLIKQSNGQDIVDDLVKMNSGSNRLSNNWQSGDHVEFLYGKTVDNIFVRKIKLYEEFKNVLDQLKRKNINNFKPIAAKIGGYTAVYSENYNRRIYRARIMKQDSDGSNNFKCNLIDIGKVDVIPSKYVFSLPNYVSLNNVPTMVRLVSLIGLPKISNSKITPYLYSLKGKTYVMEYDSKPGKSNNQEVVLKELHSGVSLNDEIQKLYKK